MTTGISVALTLIFIAIIIASLGLVFFILGLILKKPGQWVPGIIFTVVAFILGIYSLVLLGDSARYNRYRSQDYSSYNYNDQNDEYSDRATPVPDDKAKESKREDGSRVSGFIQDDDKSLIYIKVFPAANLYDMGVKITKIDTYSNTSKKQKMIPLEINFASKFKGNLELVLLSSNEDELGSSSVQVNQDGNTTFTIKFVFDKTANFLQTDHARLKTSY